MPVLTDEYMKYCPEVPSVLYHYCSVNTLISIIENYNIWLSDAEKTNDYTEMKWLLTKLQEVINETISSFRGKYDDELLQNTKRIAFKTVDNLLEKKAPISQNAKNFFACFSESSDLLSQWRAYGDDGNGVAIGFNTEVLKGLLYGPFYTLTKVIYSREDTFKFLHIALDEQLNWAIEASIDEKKEGYSQSELVMNVSLLILSIWQESFIYKNDMFAEEQEWRIFRKLQSDNYSEDEGVDAYGYSDFLDGFFTKNDKYLGDFTRSSLKFRGTDNDLRVYFELGFEKRKRDIVTEIIIGPKCRINEFDLKLLLAKNGYIEDVFSNSINIKRSECPYI